MANRKISDLQTKNTPAPGDLLPIVDTGVTPLTTKKTTFASIISAFDLLSAADVSTVAVTGSYNDLTNKPAAYSLPTATNSVLGGVKIGGGISINSGVISVSTDYAPTNHNHEIGDVDGLQAALDSKATPADVTTAIQNVIDGAPQALDTLNELAAALGDDGNFAVTITNALANRPLTSSLADVAFSGSYPDLTNKPNIVLVAPEWSANHTIADGTRYLANDVVYSGGNVYKALYENESEPVTNATYWQNLGAGSRINIDGRDIPNIPYPVTSVNGQTGVVTVETGNPFDQDLNTTDSPTFNNIVFGDGTTQTTAATSGPYTVDAGGAVVFSAGTNNAIFASGSSILSGSDNYTDYNNSHIIGSRIFAQTSDATHVNNLRIVGVWDANTNNYVGGDLVLPNSASLGVGSFDNNTSGNGGISLFCTVGYELNWQGGHLKNVQIGSGVTAPIYLDSGIQFPNVDGTSAFMGVDQGGITFPDGTTQTTAPLYTLGSGGNSINPITGNNDAYGSFSVVGNGWNNTASGNYSAVSGGRSNTANNSCSAVSGGRSNTASGYYSTVSGGWSNTASGYISTVSGGWSNTASASYSTVSGGYGNTASGIYSAVGGGKQNTASGTYSFIGSGRNNNASSIQGVVAGGYSNDATGMFGSVVSGGYFNLSSADYSTVSGGRYNTASGTYSAVGGGRSNSASGAFGSTVSGGGTNTASGNYGVVAGGNVNTASGYQSVIGGGFQNIANALLSTVSGGRDNTASGTYSAVGGGKGNTASGYYSVVGGGFNNTALARSVVAGGEGNSAGTNYSAVGGGRNNNASVAYSTVSGGQSNTASASYSTVSGGYGNNASGAYSGVVGGKYNTASGAYSGVVDGKYNTASGQYCIVGCGQSNTANGTYTVIGGGIGNATTQTSGAATISGGRENTASGYYCTIGGGWRNEVSNYYSTVSGGEDNTASGQSSTVSGGSYNIASGGYSSVVGGLNNTASGTYSAASGGFAKAAHHGAQAHAAGNFAYPGDAQRISLIARRETAYSSTPSELYLDGAGERLVIPPQTAWNFDIKLSLYSAATDSSAAWNIRGAICRKAFNDEVVLLGSNITESWISSDLSAVSVSVSADNTNKALSITVVGLADYGGQRWVAVVDIAQASNSEP